MPTAYAHGLYDPLPPGIFQFKLPWDPTLLFFILLLFLYIRGLRSFVGRSPVKTWQKFCFFAGVSSLIIALLPPIDPLSDQLFSIHMVQHLMITLVGVPLMMFGAPYFVIVRGFTPWLRKNVYLPVLRNRPIQAVHGFFTQPLVALAMYELSYWFWHVPVFYNMALLNDGIHLLEHGSFAVTSMYLWRNVIDPYPMKARLPLPGRILFMGAVTAADIILSAFLAFSDKVWYAYEGIPMPHWWAWSHLEDQHLGGLIMWIPGGFIELMAMTVVFFVWASRERAKDLAREDSDAVVTSKEATALT